MIYLFPDLDTLRLAISSLVPPEITLAPALGSVDADGRIRLEPSAALPKKVQNDLRKVGVQTSEDHGEQNAEEIFCWTQMLPVVREMASLPMLSAQAPVLFDLPDAGQLSGLVGEMLRLGNDRQGFRWLKDGKQSRVLLRVIGPPYYSLLRALEANDNGNATRAYVEQAPRVWAEIGYTHPQAAQLKPPAGKMLMLRPPRAWSFLDEAPFHDIYDILDFTLPEAKIGWQDVEPTKRLKVPLRIVQTSGTDQAELWVIRDNPLDQVDALVRDADDRLLERLSFAVGERDGKQSIVLRVRPSKHLPPVLVLQAQGFRSHHQKLQNLFLPTGYRLKPPLRRDAVRKLLADDPDRVTWLWPQLDNSFIPESLPENAFRPLQDWVDYVLDHDHQALTEWMEAARFAFEPYANMEDEPPEPKQPRTKAPKDRERKSMLAEEPEAENVDVPAPAKTKKKARAAEEMIALAEEKPNELKERLKEFETRFLGSEGPLDEPDRQAIWPQMAALHTALNQKEDAAICWLNSMWETETPSFECLNSWLGAESNPSGTKLTTADLDRWLANKDPIPGELRALAAMIIHACFSSAVEPPGKAKHRLSEAEEAIVARLPPLQRYLTQHESRLNVRAVWLVWTALARLSSGDVLTLARARDRVLERLLGNGMSTEYDLASFLRSAGQQNSERFRSVRERVANLRQLAHKWVALSPPKGAPEGPVVYTQAYKDLMFAFGLARLGEVGKARELQKSASETLQMAKDGAGNPDEVHQFLLEALTYRINQAIDGKPHGGPLPAELLERIQRMSVRSGREDRKKEEERLHFLLFKINRMREKSRILEPQEKIDSYRSWRANQDDLSKEIAKVFEVEDKQEAGKKLLKLLSAQKKSKEQQLVLAAGLELGPSIGEQFTVDIVARLVNMREQLPPIMDHHELEQRAKLLERAIFLSAHYDRGEYLQLLVGTFIQLLDSQRGKSAAQEIHLLAGQCLRGLRKLGLREEINALLQRMTDIVVQGEDMDQLRNRLAGNWHSTLLTLLQISSGWLYFGKVEQATPIIEEARLLLLEEDQVPEANRVPQAIYKTDLTCGYATTLGQAPVDSALRRLEELFKNLPRLVDTFTTNSHYTLLQLRVVESVVLAVVNDDFAVGQNVRRWLDEDEYLVRRRIHRDLRAWMAQAGL